MVYAYQDKKTGRFRKGHHRKHTSKEIEKISRAHIGIGEGAKLSEEHRKKISQGVKGKNKGKRNGNWIDGRSIGKSSYSDKWTTFFRWSIRKRDNYTCQECGKKQIEEEKIFPVHHIDYDKLNDNPTNLITLCNSCHGKTTYTKKSEYFKKRYSELQNNRFSM